MNEQPEKKTGSPEWAMQPFSDLTGDIEHLWQLLEMSIRGISMIQAVPQMVRAIAKANDRTEHEETVKELAIAEKQAAFAKQELENGFPVLHANTALAIWSHLEAGIRLFLAKWLEHEEAAFEVDAIQKMKVKIGEYERLQGEDRFFYILDRLEQEMVAPLKCGVNRFESILEPFGLAGRVDAEVQRDLFELNQVRNCLMHRGGRADRRFIDACPWLNLEVGQQIKVTHEATRRYIDAVMRYATELVCRIGERFGRDMSEFR
jgi:hypothetical protein